MVIVYFNLNILHIFTLPLEMHFCNTNFCFLIYFCRHRPNEVELLFDLLRVFTHRHIPDFQFLKAFMKDDVAKVFILTVNDQNFSKLLFTVIMYFQRV